MSGPNCAPCLVTSGLQVLVRLHVVGRLVLQRLAPEEGRLLRPDHQHDDDAGQDQAQPEDQHQSDAEDAGAAAVRRGRRCRAA